MASRKKKEEAKPELVRRSILVDPTQMEIARKVLGVNSDAEVLRFALEHLFSHFEHGEEE